MKRVKATGWLVDTYISDENAVLWIALQHDRRLRLTDRYTPDFYVAPKGHVPLEELASALREHPNVLFANTEHKFTAVNMRERTSVVHVYIDYAKNFRRVFTDLETFEGINACYNIDILHIQRYLFQQGIVPTTKVEVEYDEKSRLLEWHRLEDGAEIRPPPFVVVIFDVAIANQTGAPNVDRDPISKVIVFDDTLNVKRVFEGDEETILAGFEKHLQGIDPDFLVSPAIETLLMYTVERARRLKYSLQLGREEVNIFDLQRLTPHAHPGRVHVNLHTFLELGIAGIVERSRFTLAPPGLSGKWPAGRTIDSRQCFEALQRDVLLSQYKSTFKHVTTVKDTLRRDRGGFILSPHVGLHENVAELDYESMYPHIIIKHNISYETVTPYFVNRAAPGFLGEITQNFLERRLYFKHLKTKYAKHSREWWWCEQRQRALKGILVCIYGYSGCFANRFNNVAAYEEINRIARNTLVNTINVAVQKGFKALYADSDSVFIKKQGAKRQDYETLAKIIHKKTGLPIALDQHYKFLIFLPQEADPSLGATKRYFGKLMDGGLHYRGIELRRRDYPVFLKQFQRKLLDTLFDAACADQVKLEQTQKARKYVVDTCNKIAEGKIALESLIVSKVLRKPVIEYKSRFPHVVAATQLMQKGKKVNVGEAIEFLFVNAAHRNPFRRVLPAAILENNHHYYDKEKYLQMALDVAETTLGVLGFNRKQLGARGHSKDGLERKLLGTSTGNGADL